MMDNENQICELDQPIWSVVSEHGVLHHAVSRKHAEEMVKFHHEQRTEDGFRVHQGLTIITAEAAARMQK